MPKKVATKHGETHASFCLIFTPQPLAARGIVMALTGGREGGRAAGGGQGLLSAPELSPYHTKLLEICTMHGYDIVVVQRNIILTFYSFKTI